MIVADGRCPFLIVSHWYRLEECSGIVEKKSLFQEVILGSLHPTLSCIIQVLCRSNTPPAERAACKVSSSAPVALARGPG